MFAAISFSLEKIEVRVNFGESDFQFDVESYIQSVKEDEYLKLLEEETDPSEVFGLVHNYLLLSGYGATLDAYKREASFD